MLYKLQVGLCFTKMNQQFFVKHCHTLICVTTDIKYALPVMY